MPGIDTKKNDKIEKYPWRKVDKSTSNHNEDSRKTGLYQTFDLSATDKFLGFFLGLVAI